MAELQANHLERQLTASRNALAAKDAQVAQATASIAAMQHAGAAKDKLLLDMRDAIEEAEQGVLHACQLHHPAVCE